MPLRKPDSSGEMREVLYLLFDDRVHVHPDMLVRFWTAVYAFNVTYHAEHGYVPIARA